MEELKTDILSLVYTYGGLQGGVINLSGGYHHLILTWAQHFQLHGSLLLVADYAEPGNEYWPSVCSGITDVSSIGFENDNPTYIANICQPIDISKRFGGIICQAVLEHVCNPFGAIQNLGQLLEKDGILLTHTHTIEAPYHAHPVDCCRFFKDFFIGAQTEWLRLEDIAVIKDSIFAAYRRTNG